MGLVLSIFSVIGEERERICKFCYGDDGEIQYWLHPCKCSGSLYWVHKSCFELWMRKATAQQQLQCQTCRYHYKKSWVLKTISEWSIPTLDLSTWQWLEIFLDIYSTYRFFKGMVLTFEGKRSYIIQILHFLFWRTLIMSDRRLAWYASLGRKCCSAVFNVSVLPFEKCLTIDVTNNQIELDDEENDELERILNEINQAVR